MKKISYGLQAWLIAFAFMIVIPGAVYLGSKLISSKIDSKAYHETRDDFFQGVSYKNHEKYAALEIKWKETDTFLEWEKKRCLQSFNLLIIAGTFSCVLFYIGSIFVMPIVSSGLLYTAGILVGMYSFSYYRCAIFHGIGLIWIELLFVFISLLIVLWYAYQYCEKRNDTIKGK